MGKFKEMENEFGIEFYCVKSTEQLLSLIEHLREVSRIDAIGFDVFGTLLTSLYTKNEQSNFISEQIFSFLQQRLSQSVDLTEVTANYRTIRNHVKSAIQKERLDIPAKEVECPETKVISAVGEFYGVNNVSNLIKFVQDTWLSYDAENTRSVSGMVKVVSKSVEIFGQDKVGIYTNNSCTKKHLTYLLNKNGYVRNGMLSQAKVFVSSETGLRKPNSLMFINFSNQLSTIPRRVAFVGDGDNDVLFATNLQGIGIKVRKNLNSNFYTLS